MTDTNDIAVWDRFWQTQEGGEAGGCLPDGWRGIEEAQKCAWREFAAVSATDSDVLDLATGDGRVLSWIGELHESARLVGVDSAGSLPPGTASMQLLAATPIENLPFEPRSFDLVTSQFGFEYSRVEETAREIARVLRPDGRAGLLMHRGDGPILAHNLGRAEAIRWIADSQKLFDRARQAARAGAQFYQGFIAHCRNAAAEGATAFGKESAAWEIAAAIGQAFQMEQRHRSGALRETIEAIAAQAHNELDRIASLERACAVADDKPRLAKAFAAAGLMVSDSRTVAEEAKPPFATFVTLRTG